MVERESFGGNHAGYPARDGVGHRRTFFVTSCTSTTVQPILAERTQSCAFTHSQCADEVQCLYAASSGAVHFEGLSRDTREVLGRFNARLFEIQRNGLQEDACRRALYDAKAHGQLLFQARQAAASGGDWSGVAWIAVGLLVLAAAAAGADSGGSGGCCRVCTVGKACGDSCINTSLQCHQSRGCACNG